MTSRNDPVPQERDPLTRYTDARLGLMSGKDRPYWLRELHRAASDLLGHDAGNLISRFIRDIGKPNGKTPSTQS